MTRLKNIFSFFLFFISLSSFSQLNFYRNAKVIVLDTNGDTLKNPWAGGLNYAQLSEIDLDLDGIKDLFVFDKQDNRIVPFINNGVANQVSYTHAPEYIQDFPDLQDWVLLRDYNCDGKMDIFSSSSGGIAVYKNTSTTSLTFSLVTSALYSNYQPNNINIFVSSRDIPAIDDIDGDGDLDILTFGVTGSYVEYHRNLSIETFGTCDSLNFQLRNRCWGFFKEGFSSNSVELYDTCGFNVLNPERSKHSGSTLLTLDVDANGTKDLVLGDLSHSNLLLLYNDDSSSDFTASSIVGQDKMFPSNNSFTAAVNLNVFPAGYYLDVNNDNIKDLIVSNNCSSGCENDNNVWYYKNNAVDNNPDFAIVHKNFLQDGMIEVGEGAYPVFFDYNSDGLKDIVLGNYGEFDKLAGTSTYKPFLSLYENIGTSSTPSYKLVNNDYINLSTLNLDINGNKPTLRLTPTFGDLDGDNDVDMIIGDYLGHLHYFMNSAGAGNTAIFTLAAPQYFGIDVGNFASPQLIDLDRDNLLDLVIGKRDGYLSYYRNVGTSNSPNFNLITDSLGYVETKMYADFEGSSTPFFFDDAGSYKMIAGSNNGHLFYYDNIDGNLGGTFNIVDSMYLDIWVGSRSSVSLSDVTNDGKLDMLIGDYSGGITFYEGGINSSIINNNNVKLEMIKIYPNPTNNNVTIDLGGSNLSDAIIRVSDILGKELFRKKPLRKKIVIDLSNYVSGIYLIQFSNQFNTSVYKVVKE